MATQVQSSRSGVVPYRVTVKQFLKMIDANVFPEGHHVELLAGVLVARTKGIPHDFVVGRLASRLRPLVSPAWFIREDKSLRIGRHWRPEPDIAILREPDVLYAHRDPTPADVALLAEVADSSYAEDSGIKLRAYAAAGIPVYWIVNLPKSQVEVYTDPHGRGKSAGYRAVATLGETESVPVVVEGQERGRIAVAELLP